MAGTNPTHLRLLDGDIEEDPIIHDDFTSSIVNENRELILDGKVVRYTKSGTFVFHDDFTARVNEINAALTWEEVEKLKGGHDFEEDPFFEIEPGIFIFGSPGVTDKDQYYQKTIAMNNANAATVPWNTDPFNFPFCNRTSNKRHVTYTSPHWTGGFRETVYIYFESNRRMKAKAWSTNYATHSTSGYFTKLQRRRLGVWWASDADIVSISVRGNFYYPHPDNNNKIYIPFKLDPIQGNGYWNLTDRNEAKIGFGLITAQIGISNNVNSLLNSASFCDPSKDFNNNVNSYLGSNSKYCKPKWKTSNAVKIKESESCHYVRRGSYQGEIQIKIKVNG